MSWLIDDEEFKSLTGNWDYSTLPDNVRIGHNCFLARKKSFLGFRSARQPGLILGNGVKVYTWTEFNVEPMGAIEVGDESILAGVTFMCADRIDIGKRVVASYNVTIADSDFHPKDPYARKLDAIANAPLGDRTQRPIITTRPVIVEDDVWIGIGAIILKGVRLGRGARVGAGAVVTTDVPPGRSIVGNPARLVDEAIDI